LELAVFEERAELAVGLVQGFVYAATGVLLYLWLARRMRAGSALAAALLFGLNPYGLTLVGLLHYSMLHLFLLVPALWALDAAIERNRSRAFLLAGIAWGLSNLVRPLTLLLPALVLVSLLLGRRASGFRALKHALALALGMALVLGPWTLRNYRVSGRLMPVSDNLWMTLWGQTYKPLGVHPDHYTWFELYFDHLPLFASVTGRLAWDYKAHTRHAGALEEAFRRAALRNLREQPLVYAQNLAASLWSYSAHINTVGLKLFQQAQHQPRTWRPPQEWFRVGHPQDFETSLLAPAFAWLFRLLTLLAALGGALALRRRDDALLAAGIAFVAMLLSHGLVYMHLMYYYSKLPLVIAAAFYGLDALGSPSTRVGALALVLRSALPALGAAMTAWLLWPS
jgi:hypothetical protein